MSRRYSPRAPPDHGGAWFLWPSAAPSAQRYMLQAAKYQTAEMQEALRAMTGGSISPDHAGMRHVAMDAGEVGSMSAMVKGFGRRQAYESRPCTNPRGSGHRSMGISDLAWL